MRKLWCFTHFYHASATFMDKSWAKLTFYVGSKLEPASDCKRTGDSALREVQRARDLQPRHGPMHLRIPLVSFTLPVGSNYGQFTQVYHESANFGNKWLFWGAGGTFAVGRKLEPASDGKHIGDSAFRELQRARDLQPRHGPMHLRIPLASFSSCELPSSLETGHPKVYPSTLDEQNGSLKYPPRTNPGIHFPPQPPTLVSKWCKGGLV